MSLRIRIHHGQHAGKTWRLARSGLYSIGRRRAASLHVLDMKVSNQHGIVRVRAEGDAVTATLSDSGSRHGTLLNGQPVTKESVLKPGDEIRVGLTILHVLSDGDADAEAAPLPPEKAEAFAPAGETTLPGTEESAAERARRLPPDALVGTEMGGYRVLEKVGQGGMGAVYLAEQVSLHREVALKVLSEQFTSDRAFVDQFVNEARAAGALNHPNVVQVYDVGRENGRYYFSMEFMAGGSLEEQLGSEGPADWREALNWLIDATNALIFAQRREILHRDVKPENLMLAEDGSAKLCDLGLAKRAEHPDLLEAGIIGTPAFIAPEAIRRRKDIDVRADLYSLGCSFYRILTGKNAYSGQTVKEILLGHLNKPVPRVRDKTAEVPRDLDEVIYRLMQKEPDERFATPQELWQALDKIRVQHGLEAHGIRPQSKKPLVIAAVVVLAGIAAAIWAITRPEKVIETGLSEEEIQRQRELEEEARRKAFDAFLSKAKEDLAELRVKKANGNLRFQDNWEDASTWDSLTEDFEALAQRLREDETHGTTAEVEAVAEAAEAEARDIGDYVALRRSVDKEIKDGRRNALRDLRKRLQALRSRHQEAVERGDWPKAVEGLGAEDIQKLVRPFVERQVQEVLPTTVPPRERQKFAGELLLDPEDHIGPVLKEVLGDPPGEAMVQRALDAEEAAHLARLAPARDAFDQGTHEGYAAAQEALEAYLEQFPEAAPSVEGPMAEALARHETEARDLLFEARRADALLLESELGHDKNAYFDLLKALRAPRGLLFAFRLAEARTATERVVASMRHPAYVRHTTETRRDVEALQALFAHLAATHPDGWARDRVEMTDERGRVTSLRVREVTAEGLRIEREERSFADLGPDWLLHSLFYLRPGEPRFAFEGEDHRGLAVLAEMAVDYALARQHYQSYLAALPADRMDTQQVLRRRLSTLAVEEEAGGLWRQAVDSAREVQRFLDAHDPAVIGEDEFWKKSTRDELLEAEADLARRLMDAQGARAKLRDGRFAGTVWGSVIRPAPAPEVRYAGEPDVFVPPPRDEPPPGPGDAPPPGDGPGEDGGG